MSFTVCVNHKLALNQLRLSVGESVLKDDDLRRLHQEEPLLFRDGRALPDDEFATANGLFLSLDLKGDDTGRVGYRARKFTSVLDIGSTGAYDWQKYWDPVQRESVIGSSSSRMPSICAVRRGGGDPSRVRSGDGRLRPDERRASNPLRWLLRSRLCFDPDGELLGSRAALEVRAHDVPFAIEHGQRVAKLTLERMAALPERLYGEVIGSSYQGQGDTLSKHFRQPEPLETEVAPERPPVAEGPRLFEDE